MLNARTSQSSLKQADGSEQQIGVGRDYKAMGTDFPKLEVRHLTKIYPGQGKPRIVLEDIYLQLFQNQFVCLVGASGCGKSTLLNLIAGLVPPTSGDILVDGKLVKGPGSDRGVVFQHYTLYPWLTVSQNIAFSLQLHKLPKSEQRDRVDYYLQVIGLTQFADAFPKQLSGGMKQRVAIARALASEPAVLLMDEPFGALDAQTKEQMQQFLLELWAQTHITVLMVTHDVEEAIYLSQRMYVMSSCPGRIKQELMIDLPCDRDLELKLSTKFLAIKREIIHTLRD
jgi:NitT/TauT family transport system ATP-binding protein